ncbi:hypothetical protein [Sporisorium scitamineum]|uniref:Uncharacterized protein n=1 Tax=Sporisorium scitamineum TaxID=49012 RepID=A0A0F7S1D1_9BASI|nr:hypothetical protein [Sporisorium scitamineum]
MPLPSKRGSEPGFPTPEDPPDTSSTSGNLNTAWVITTLGRAGRQSLRRYTILSRTHVWRKKL